MAGGLTISTLNDSSGVLATQNGMSGICKAWVTFTNTGTVSNSFNVSSITVTSANSDYTVNFTTAMPSAVYATITGSQNWRAGGPCISGVTYGTTPSTTAVSVTYRAYNESVNTLNNLYVAVFR